MKTGISSANIVPYYDNNWLTKRMVLSATIGMAVKVHIVATLAALPLVAKGGLAPVIDQSVNRRGVWSPLAMFPYVSKSSSQQIPAPNGLASIKVTDDGYFLISKAGITFLDDIVSFPVLTEVLWSPDSRAFVITGSDGGLVGTWETHFYSIETNGRPFLRDIEALVRPLTRTLPRCDEQVNIGASAWLNAGKELLVVVEVPPHSSCRNMGAIAGFRVSVTSWRVLERISENRLRTKWGKYLGTRFTEQPAVDPNAKRMRKMTPTRQGR
jgi:hypothetical protein